MKNVQEATMRKGPGWPVISIVFVVLAVFFLAGGIASALHNVGHSSVVVGAALLGIVLCCAFLAFAEIIRCLHVLIDKK